MASRPSATIGDERPSVQGESTRRRRSPLLRAALRQAVRRVVLLGRARRRPHGCDYLLTTDREMGLSRLRSVVGEATRRAPRDDLRPFDCEVARLERARAVAHVEEAPVAPARPPQADRPRRVERADREGIDRARATTFRGSYREWRGERSPKPPVVCRYQLQGPAPTIPPRCVAT